MSRLDQQLSFLFVSDHLKSVTRQNRLHDGSRDENVAEHSWHLTLMALLLAEYAPPGTNLAHVIKLLIVYDLVEIYAGDTMFTEQDAVTVFEREVAAAGQLFGLLPEDQNTDFTALWREFEALNTREARFAKAIDTLHPPLLTWGAGGKGSIHSELTAEQALERKRPYLEPYPELWALLRKTLNDAIEVGLLKAK